MALSKIEFNVTGGIAPYDVSLTKSGFSESQTKTSDGLVTFTNLETGNYTITVTANNGECIETKSVNIVAATTTAATTTAATTTAAPTTAAPTTTLPFRTTSPLTTTPPTTFPTTTAPTTTAAPPECPNDDNVIVNVGRGNTVLVRFALTSSLTTNNFSVTADAVGVNSGDLGSGGVTVLNSKSWSVSFNSPNLSTDDYNITIYINNPNDACTVYTTTILKTLIAVNIGGGGGEDPSLDGPRGGGLNI